MSRSAHGRIYSLVTAVLVVGATACGTVPLTMPFAGTVGEVVSVPQTPERLAVATAAGEIVVAAGLPEGVRLWRAADPGGPWREIGMLAGARWPVIDLGPNGLATIAVIDNGVILRDTATGERIVPIATSPGERVVDLRHVERPRGLLLALHDRIRGRGRVLWLAESEWSSLSPTGPDVLVLDGDGPMPVAVCGGSEDTPAVVAFSGGSGGEVKTAAARLDGSGRWRQIEPPRVTSDTDLGRELVLEPEALALSCSESELDLFVRSGAIWILRLSATGGWSVPERLVAWGPGYGASHRSHTSCPAGLAWIDNRTEQPRRHFGFPWSDSYQGQGLSAVFHATLAAMTSPAFVAPRVSNAEGAAHVLASASLADGRCAIVWAGTTRVDVAAAVPGSGRVVVMVATTAAR